MKVLLTSAVRNAGMAAVRGLAKCGVNVIGADDRQLPFNCRSRYLKRFYKHPPIDDESAFLESILAVVKKECPDVFFPIKGTHLIAKHAALFNPYTRTLLPPYGSYKVADDNRSTLAECRELGIDCPRLFDDDAADTYLRTGTNGLLVIKPRRDVGAGRGICYVSRRKSLYSAKQKIEEQWGDYVIQEHIPGGTQNMHTVNLLFDRHSHLVAYFTTRKIRQWPNTGGISALSISTHDIELVEKVLPFFKKMRWKGLAEVELKIDDRDRRAKVIEINPRVWGYFGFPICCGVNFPLAYCHAAMGRPLLQHEIGSYRKGLKYLNPFAYLKAALEDLHGTTKKRGWIPRLMMELRGKKVGNYQDLKDIRVIIAKMLFELVTVRAQNADRRDRRL
jgi:predicted ATP-grasp superfamily ATP-dependent carboligase